VLGHRFGKLRHQPRKLLELAARRLRRRAGPVGNGFELAFDGAKRRPNSATWRAISLEPRARPET
jgi:hypothetical protein